jgi:hypothetical protein
MSNDEQRRSLEYPHPFDELVVELAASAARYLYILSPSLDHAVFDRDSLADALSRLARDSRQTEVRMLINDSRPLIARGHRLLELSRRIPSVVHLRRLPEHPEWVGQTVVIRDRDGLLFKPGDARNEAFYEPASRAAVQPHLELFEDLWRYSDQDPDLRTMRL